MDAHADHGRRLGALGCGGVAVVGRGGGGGGVVGCGVVEVVGTDDWRGARAGYPESTRVAMGRGKPSVLAVHRRSRWPALGARSALAGRDCRRLAPRFTRRAERVVGVRFTWTLA